MNQHHRWREGLFIIITAFSIFLLIALLTFHRAEFNTMPGFLPQHYQDAVGRAGAAIGANARRA